MIELYCENKTIIAKEFIEITRSDDRLINAEIVDSYTLIRMLRKLPIGMFFIENKEGYKW